MADTAERRARVERLLEAARVLASTGNTAGRAFRARLLDTTGLSEPSIERALGHGLETRTSDAELQALLACTPEAPRAHVLLSSNVFVAALRAVHDTIVGGHLRSGFAILVPHRVPESPLVFEQLRGSPDCRHDALQSDS